MIDNIILFGQPGAGKGTIAKLIEAKTGQIHISTGDIFRKHIKDQTELGKKVSAILEAGDYVPDSLTNEILKDAITKQEVLEKGCLLDGYPRTKEQVSYLGKIFKEYNFHSRVLFLDAPKEEIVKRLLARGRKDDVLETIDHRFDVYERESKSLVHDLSSECTNEPIVHVDSSGTIEEVWNSVQKALNI